LCAAVRLESRNDRTEHHVWNPSNEAHDEHSNQNHGISGGDAQEHKSNTDQQSAEDTEQLASPSIGQRASEEDAPNEPGKGRALMRPSCSSVSTAFPPRSTRTVFKKIGMRFTAIARQTIPA
ncbi:MAG TPA: hypothetical protein VFV92_07145, partial [Candidatus Bathyarchaeia archaeon]|nr:hypothetical protein [Candidatus Bathyarchaeia archaeon]